MRATYGRFMATFLLLTGLAAGASAQGKLDLAGLSITHSPFSNLDNLPDNAPQTLSSFRVRVTQLEAFARVPCKLNEKLLLLVSPQYELTTFGYEQDESFSGEFSADELHKIQLGLSLTWKLSDKWQLTGFNNTNLSSDFRDGLSGDDLFLAPGVIFSKRVNEHLTMGLGAVASFVFGEQQIFPILSLRYLSPNEKFFTDITFPNLRLSYAVQEKLEVGLLMRIRGNEYNFRNLAIAGSPESTDFIRFSNILAGPELTFNMTNHLSLRFSAGININRTYEVYDTDRENIGDITPENSGFFSGGLVFRVPTD
ncbi:MAG: DUF6268 family outer membrane beta-barrel protein [Bacteroidota bacterium]